MNAYQDAEQIFDKILTKCRDISIWILYLQYLRHTKFGKIHIGKSLDEYNNERKLIENSFEQATDHIGISSDSYPLWREYIEYVRSWPDTGIYADNGKKMMTLRKIYQRVVAIPMENLDSLWKEYEYMEKQNGEHLAEKVLPEFNEKYLHAKTIYADRKRYTADIDFKRLATQPSKKLIEIQQLDQWNKWLK